MPLEMADVFAGNKFTAVSLTGQVNKVPYTPHLLGSIPGLFEADGIRTTDLDLTESNGQITIIGTTPRGAPAEQKGNPKRVARKVGTVRLARERHVSADEVQNVLASQTVPGMEQFQTAEALIAERFEGPEGLRVEMELTHEFHRLGAVKGIVYDADGVTELYNWYSFFGISALADFSVNFGSLSADGAGFEMALAGVKRECLKELNGFATTNMKLMVLCGDNYFDKVYSNKEVKAARKNRDAGRDNDSFVRNFAYDSIEYGNFTFVNYRGNDSGSVGIHTDEGRLVPVGVPGLFPVRFAPPDVLGFSNTKGLPVYALMRPEKQTSSHATVEAQSNLVTICRAPRALRRFTITT